MTLLRTPHLPPRYAQFVVPLDWSKLDLKDYLQSVYNVETYYIRSFVQYRRSEFTRNAKGTYTGIKASTPRKKMTAELAIPFVWPAELKGSDLAPWEPDQYNELMNRMEQDNERQQGGNNLQRDHELRLKLKEQAAIILKGEEIWQPTWTAFKENKKIMGRALAIQSSLDWRREYEGKPKKIPATAKKESKTKIAASDPSGALEKKATRVLPKTRTEKAKKLPRIPS